LLIDWFAPPEAGCCVAVWLRQIGFSTFYGSIVLKIYRNLQEYRVRKAQHVSVREKDMVKYLVGMLALTITGLMAWTVGSWGDPALWKTAWPQCRMQGWHVSGESTRRAMTLGGHSGRAHPSLAKLRDNILNGTIDFAEVPIADMNPEDIRAELKRVYTQLRMYKLKNLYQDNPHISKKRGGKKWSDKTGK
ncbi:hypothetical protein TELCIR_18182, partial [Teladorsagia circumcincta]